MNENTFKIEFKNNRSASIDIAPKPILLINEDNSSPNNKKPTTKGISTILNNNNSTDEDYEYLSRFKSTAARRSSHSGLTSSNLNHQQQQKKIIFPIRDSSESKYNSQTIFHPTWNEWKRQNSTTTTHTNENMTSQQQQQYHQKQSSNLLFQEENNNKKSSLSHNSYEKNFSSFSSSSQQQQQQQQQQKQKISSSNQQASNKKMQQENNKVSFNDAKSTGRVNTEAMSNIERKQTLKRQKSLNTSLKSLKSTRLVESDSDGEIQARLLTKASGSIPIEYISIRRDPKPAEPEKSPAKKSITTGTNTVVERGKKIAATNTDEELPTYNLHLSLDSLLPKIKNEVATETENRLVSKDAFTDTDSEVEKVTTQNTNYHHHESYEYEMRSRRSQYEQNNQNLDYKLEFLAKTPRLIRKKCEAYKRHARIYQEDDYVDCMDEDDRLIFGESFQSSRNQSFNSSHFMQSSPSREPITRRYVRTTNTTTYAPLNLAALYQYQQQQQHHHNQQNTADYNASFDHMNAKFDQIFGSCSRSAHYASTASDQSYSFGEVFKQNNANNSYSSSSGFYSQNGGPIIETPQSTLRSRSFSNQQHYNSNIRTCSPSQSSLTRKEERHIYKKHHQNKQHQQKSCAMQSSSLNQSFDSERQFIPIHVRSDSEYQH